MAETNTSLPNRSEVVEEICEQADDLCHIHDHITRVIANLDIGDDWFTGYDESKRAKFGLEAAVKMFIYKEARGFDQTELEQRLKGAAFVYIRFGLSGPMNQQIISYNWRRRFDHTERRTIKTAARRIREICAEHDLVRDSEPALNPEDVNPKHGIGEEHIMDAVERATDLGFTEFSADRASNAKYPLEAFFERQGYLNLADAGTTTLRRRFARLSKRPEVPHGSTHNRTMKKVAAPDPQVGLSDYEDGRRPLDWRRIRDEVLPAFHAGVEKQLDEIAGRDRNGIREPVHAAIDITTFNFWSSPFKDEADVERDEEPVVSDKGYEAYPKDDYPEMVSGFKSGNKEKAERGYKFATLTIVAENTPIVLAIEPVRDSRWWEKADESVDVVRTPRVAIVRELIEQAEKHVDLHKVFCDREFDIHAVRNVLDAEGLQYIIPKKEQSIADSVNVKEVIEDPVYNSRALFRRS